MSELPRGLRNRNPGNIRRSAVRYKGETESDDAAFKTFASTAWGYRAMFVLLHTYRVRHRIATLRGMIARWALGERHGRLSAHRRPAKRRRPRRRNRHPRRPDHDAHRGGDGARGERRGTRRGGDRRRMAAFQRGFLTFHAIFAVWETRRCIRRTAKAVRSGRPRGRTRWPGYCSSRRREWPSPATRPCRPVFWPQPSPQRHSWPS